MYCQAIVKLADCTRFRQTIEARPPAVVHGAALLATTVVFVALLWSTLTPVNLVVRAAGRVRPIDIPTKVFTAANTKVDGRVIEVPFREGDHVRRGDAVLRLDSARLENELSKLDRNLATAREELAKIDDLASLIEQQFQTSLARAEAELKQAERDLVRDTDRRQAEIKRAEVELSTARDSLARTEKLVISQAVTRAQMIEETAKADDAEQKLVVARLPVDQGRLAVMTQARNLVERDFAVRRAETASKRLAKRGEIEGVEKEIFALRLQLDQATLRSPIDGVVIQGNIKVGEVVEMGKPVLEIARQQGFRFDAFVPSEDVGLLREGMLTRVKFDAYDYQKYGALSGRVVFISPDSNVNTEGARGAVYLVKIELTGDTVGRDELIGRVKLGMSGSAEIITGSKSVLAFLMKRIRSSISLG
jgi:multidrug resistance efflux pump